MHRGYFMLENQPYIPINKARHGCFNLNETSLQPSSQHHPFNQRSPIAMTTKFTDLNIAPTLPNAKRTEIQNPELWQFPMDYPLSIIGHEGEHDSLRHEVTLILAEIFPDFDVASMVVRPSKTGRFHALRMNLRLSSADEVNRLYAALDKAKTVKTAV